MHGNPIWPMDYCNNVVHNKVEKSTQGGWGVWGVGSGGYR